MPARNRAWLLGDVVALNAVPKPECLLVVLGAGASYDCLRDYPLNAYMDGEDAVRWDEITSTPAPAYGAGPRHGLAAVRFPLTSQLADANPFRNRLLRRYPGAGVVVSHLKDALQYNHVTDSLETALRAMQEESDRDPQAESWLIQFAFYLRDLILECTSYMHSEDLGFNVTNYLHLARQLRNWQRSGDRARHVCYVTFNYDPLIDLALHAVYERDFASHDVTPQDDVSFLRPHGSALWQWTVLPASGDPSHATRHSGSAESRAQRVHQLLTSDAWAVDRSAITTESLRHLVEGQETQLVPGVPAMALPVDGKTSNFLVWPDSQRQHLSDLAYKFDVTRMLTIGWRAAEPHLLPTLARSVVTTGPRLMVVDKDRDEELKIAKIIEHVMNASDVTVSVSPLLRSGESHLGHGGFGGAIRAGRIERWLEERTE